MAHIERD